MQSYWQLLRKNSGLSPYVWVVFYILPFYFIFSSSATRDVVIGIALIIVFFGCYMLSFVSKGWLVYFWTSIQILVSIAMSVIFGYVYFALFLAFFIGNLKNRIAFFIMYGIHLLSTVATINYGFVTKNSIIITQLPFVLLSLAAVILLPVSTFNKNNKEELEEQLEDANKRISELVKLEERQRIARDLHDTLGQKLSLVGLKSDLASKLVYKNPRQAKAEMEDVQKTARTALKEVREMVTQMRGTKLEDELFRIKQILKAAEIEFTIEGDPRLTYTSLIAENVVSMCLKEAVNNVVKHSGAKHCVISIEPTRTELVLRVRDDGVGMPFPAKLMRGNGLQGIKERLEFVNGSLEIGTGEEDSDTEQGIGKGTELLIRVPNVYTQEGAEVSE